MERKFFFFFSLSLNGNKQKKGENKGKRKGTKEKREEDRWMTMSRMMSDDGCGGNYGWKREKLWGRERKKREKEETKRIHK